MNRGILKITNNEASELLKNLNLANYLGTPLGNKLGSIDLPDIENKIMSPQERMEYCGKVALNFKKYPRDIVAPKITVITKTLRTTVKILRNIRLVFNDAL